MEDKKPKKYKVLKHRCYQTGPYTIRSVEPGDIFLIKTWRNEQMDLLRQGVLLTDESQKAYFDKTVFPEFGLTQPSQILLSIVHNDRLIGYGGLVHINWEFKRAEVSFLVETDRMKPEESENFANDFRAFFNTLQWIAFQDLGWNKLSTEAYDIPLRRPLFPLLDELGCVQEGRLRDWVLADGVYVDAVVHGKLRREYIPDNSITFYD